MPDVVVDAHHHLWVRARTPQPWIDPVSMAAIDADFTVDDLPAREHGVAATVVVQSVPREDETADLLALAASPAGRDAGVAGVVGWADLFARDLARRLDELRAGRGGERLVGIRVMVQSEADPGYLDRSDVRRGIATIGAAGLPVDVVVRHDQLASCARLARDLPDVPFVLDHLGKPPIAAAWRPGADDGAVPDGWRRDLAALAAHDNVVAKLSGLVTEADWDAWTVDQLRPVAAHALDVLGPGRVMFGSDWPVSLLATDYGRWLDVVRDLLDPLPDAARAAVLGGTATRTYGLDVGVPASARRTISPHEKEQP